VFYAPKNPENRPPILRILYTETTKQQRKNKVRTLWRAVSPPPPPTCDRGRINSNKNSQRSTWNFPQIAKNKIKYECVCAWVSEFLVKTSWKMHPMRRSKNASLYLSGAWSSAFHFPNFHMCIERQTATATATLEWRWRHKWHGPWLAIYSQGSAFVSARYMDSICTSYLYL